MMRVAVVALLGLAACAQVQPTVVRELGVGAMPGVDSTCCRGLAADEEGGLLVAGLWNLWRFHDGQTEVLFDVNHPDRGAFPRILTDMAALPDGRIALLFRDQERVLGAVYDPEQDRIQPHFFEDGFSREPGEATYVGQTLAYDARADQIAMLVRTVSPDARSFVADVVGFDANTGERSYTHRLDDERFYPGGLVASPEGWLFGEAGVLWDYALGDAAPTRRMVLYNLGIEDIRGLALLGDTLVLIDGERLVWIEHWDAVPSGRSDFVWSE